MSSLPVEFTISVVGETTGETFKGLFKIKSRLSHRETLTQDQMRRDLLGPKPADASQGAIASAMVFAKIWIHLLEAPSWWKDQGNGVDLVDEAPVVAVYDQIRKMEEEALEKNKKAGQAAAEDLKTDSKG